MPPGGAFHVGLTRHDAVVISNVRFYYLSGRPPATRYHELHPGITDRDDVQREMIADLVRKKVRCVVLWDFGWTQATLDRILARRTAAVPGTGSRLLDEHIREHYDPVLEVDEYVVYWAKDAEPPVLR